MSRAKRGFKAKRRRNKIFKLAKGFHFDRRNKFRHTSETVRRALHNMYKSRRILKRDMRRLWITRVGAAARLMDSSYSRFMHQLKQKNIQLNRKMLADLAARDLDGFKAVYQASK